MQEMKQYEEQVNIFPRVESDESLANELDYEFEAVRDNMLKRDDSV